MAFLDNSGDIILDAVLTENGRKRLAKADGSFRIAKFALGDDEINYGTYDPNHASGSAYHGLVPQQTPILEAFTLGAAGIRSFLLTSLNNKELYRSILKPNTLATANAPASDGSHLIAVTKISRDAFGNTAIDGFSTKDSAKSFKVDNGFDTTEIDPSNMIDAENYETQYVITMDNRLIELTDMKGNVQVPNFVDDDNVAHYTVSQGSSPGMISDKSNNNEVNSAVETLAGPRGSSLDFKVKAKLDVQQTNHYFNTLGYDTTVPNKDGDLINTKRIDANIVVAGGTTAGSTELSVSLVKTADE